MLRTQQERGALSLALGLLSDSMGSPLLRGLPLVALVSGLLVGACSGKTSNSAGGAGGGEGGRASSSFGGGVNASGNAGSLATAGSPSSVTRNPDLPEPPDDTCEQFHLTEGVCATNCPSWPCESTLPQNPFGSGWCFVGSAKTHCLSSFDCAAAATETTNALLINCLAFNHPCLTDADCPADGPYCVVDARYASGTCDAGHAGARCRADDDCQPGNLCVAVNDDGTRACVDRAEGSRCNLDAECKGKRCIHAPGVSINGLNPDPAPSLAGLCSTGTSGALCFVDEVNCPPNTTCSLGVNDGKCLGDARCIRVPMGIPTLSGAVCSAGNVGDPCLDDSDCKSGHCPSGVDSVCSAGALGEPCVNSADCESGFCAPPSKVPMIFPGVCTNGEIGASCLSPADCKSGHCEPAPEDAQFWSMCVQ